MFTHLKSYIEAQKKSLRIWSEYHNPYHYWWKVRKFWKIPKIHLAHVGKITWWYGLPISLKYYNKFIDIRLSGLGWKTKEDSVRFEWNPYLCWTFFRKWQIIFVWDFQPYFCKRINKFHSYIGSELTWEAIVEMIWKNKSISDACHDVGKASTFNRCEDSDYYIPSRYITPFRNLTDYGWEQYYEIPRSKQLKQENYE